MLTTLIDLLSTGSSIGFVASVAAVGIVVLPWRQPEATEATNALDAFARLPLLWMVAAPLPQPEVARG